MVFAAKMRAFGDPDIDDVSTSIVERHNLTLRMSVRRLTRLTNAFSKKLERHELAQALYFVWYNWVKQHGSLGTTPAVAAGLADYPHDMRWIVGLIKEPVVKPGLHKVYPRPLEELWGRPDDGRLRRPGVD